jgi:putative transposase
MRLSHGRLFHYLEAMPPSAERNRRRMEADSSAARAQLQRETTEAEWESARRTLHDLKQIENREISSVEVERLAKKWGVARATVYRKLSRFREGGDLAALLPRRRGQRPGSSTFDAEIEFIVQDCAKRLWALSENATVEDIFTEIAKECRARQLSLPSRATVGRRIQKLRVDPSNFVGEAKQALREKKRLVRSNYTVSEPLAVVQIDHTLADILLVEPQTHCLIGRPTLTIAIDIATRCVLGFCASLEAPSSLLVALCLETAVFPKTWLQGSSSGIDWPMYGLMKSIHSDNGREFHGQAFRRGCDLNGIDTIYRPPATPRFGGHIERLIGTFMRRTRLLPGNTYSDMLGHRPRSAESKATLTLGDYRLFLTEEIERYHNRVHRTLGSSPRSAWERSWKRSRGVESPSLPKSRDRFLMDFLPVRTRVVTREGIEIDGLRFSHGSLQGEINPNVKRVVRVDPRDISRVYLETPDGPYLSIPLMANRTMPNMSWWEWKAIRRQRNGHVGTAAFEPVHATTALRAGRARARRIEWQALQAIQSLPAPDTRLRPIVSSDVDSPLPQWEILD